MNLSANFLGLGNAATPIGLKAMDNLKKSNLEKNKMSNEMKMLILINTASIQLIPTNIIAIRASLNSENPGSILLPVWGATVCAAFAGVIALKILMNKGK